ncbi:MAG: sugar transferase, partial [Burkholderiaceae bacterium]
MNMIKVFNHYLHRQTIHQVSLDLMLVVLVVSVMTLWQGVNLVSTLPFVAYAVLLGIGVLLINVALGFYQRVPDRSVTQSRARGLLALLLVIPLIYGIFQVPFTNAANRRLLALGTLVGVALVVAHRIYKAHASPRGAFRHRVLVFGTGPRAALVGKTLKRDDPNVDVVGYYVGANEPKAEVSAWGILSPNRSLTETALDLDVDEIVVA